MSDSIGMSDEVKTADDAKEKPVYELGFHVLPTLGDAKVLEFVEQVKGEISKRGGEVIDSGEPELIDLAYTMTKRINNKYERFDTAFFGWVKFDLDAEKTAEFKKLFDVHADVLRFILIKTDRETPIQRPVTLREVTPSESKTIDAPRTKEEGGAISEKELSDKIEKMIS